MIDSDTIVKTLKYHEATIENAFVKCALRKAITLIDQQELAINNLKTELENRVIEDQPKIVQCKDCKHRYKHSCGYFYANGQIMRDDWFCADGERKDENAGPGKDA